MSFSLVLALVAVAGVALIFLGLHRTLFTPIDVEARLEAFGTKAKTRAAQVPQEQQSALATTVEKAVAGRAFASDLQRELSRANIKMTVGEFLVFRGISIIVGAVVVALVFRQPVAALGGALLGFFFPGWYIGRAKSGRITAFNNQLGDTIAMLANSLRSGYSLLQSMEMVAREAPSPTREEFQRVVREVGLGLSTEEALANLVRRVGSEDLDLMVTAINVQMEVGGNLAQILETIGNTIRERVRIKGEVKVLTAQQSLSGCVISGLPVALAGGLYLLNRPYMEGFFKPGPFLCMPICAGLLIVGGYFAMQKMMEIEV